MKKASCYNIGWRPAIALECSGNGITPGAIVGMLIGGLFLLCVAAWFYTRYQQQENAKKLNLSGGGTVAQRTDSISRAGRANNERLRGFQNMFQNNNIGLQRGMGQQQQQPGRGATVFRNNSMSAPLSAMNKQQTMSYPQAGNQQQQVFNHPQRTRGMKMKRVTKIVYHCDFIFSTSVLQSAMIGEIFRTSKFNNNSQITARLKI